jgi:hypothetical protein
MISVLTATSTELAELKPIRRSLFVLRRYVIAALAVVALQHNIIAWHKSISDCCYFRLPIADCRLDLLTAIELTAIEL